VRDDRERLADVLAAIDRIRRHVQDDRARFDIDELLQSAVLHWIRMSTFRCKSPMPRMSLSPNRSGLPRGGVRPSSPNGARLSARMR
jgi:hypothetical protein